MDGSIDVVHCYSMRNGLYGGPVEARLIWSKLDFSEPDYHRSGHARNEYIVNVPITQKIVSMAVNEVDLSAFLIA